MNEVAWQGFIRDNSDGLVCAVTDLSHGASLDVMEEVSL
jgi:hypothetical protein